MSEYMPVIFIHYIVNFVELPCNLTHSPSPKHLTWHHVDSGLQNSIQDHTCLGNNVEQACLWQDFSGHLPCFFFDSEVFVKGRQK
jgi:hypothetical protein